LYDEFLRYSSLFFQKSKLISINNPFSIGIVTRNIKRKFWANSQGAGIPGTKKPDDDEDENGVCVPA